MRQSDHQHRFRQILFAATTAPHRSASPRTSSATPTGWPLNHPQRRITSSFGPRNHPNSGQLKPHEGVDIAAPMRTPIIATADGIVSFSGTQRGYGQIVILNHGDGIETAYAHLSARNIQVGHTVKRNQTIGRLGQSANATAPHVHYEIRQNGTPTNPNLR